LGSILKDKTQKPEFKNLAEVLGEKFIYLNELKNSLNQKYGSLSEEWKFYGQKSGWTMKLLLGKRNLFFLIPKENCFDISLVFGEKAFSIIEKIDLPKEIIEKLQNAEKYSEGRGLTVEVN